MTGALTVASVEAIMADLRRVIDLPPEPERLMGPIGDNANLGLPLAGMVVRITPAATGAARARHEVQVAEWAASAGLPVVRPAHVIDDQPLLRNGVAVTFWTYVSEPRQATPGQIGGVLRELHSATPPTGPLLGPVDLFTRQRGHLAAASALASGDRAFLGDLLDRLETAYGRLRFGWPDGVVHCDPHRKNVVHGRDGVVMLDLEGFGIGPREVDLIVPAVYERVGWYSHDDYAAFAQAYGYDVTTWAGFPTLAAIRELRRTLWLAARLAREPHLSAEVARRIDSLRRPGEPRHWSPGT